MLDHHATCTSTQKTSTNTVTTLYNPCSPAVVFVVKAKDTSDAAAMCHSASSNTEFWKNTVAAMAADVTIEPKNVCVSLPLTQRAQVPPALSPLGTRPQGTVNTRLSAVAQAQKI